MTSIATPEARLTGNFAARVIRDFKRCEFDIYAEMQVGVGTPSVRTTYMNTDTLARIANGSRAKLARSLKTEGVTRKFARDALNAIKTEEGQIDRLGEGKGKRVEEYPTIKLPLKPMSRYAQHKLRSA